MSFYLARDRPQDDTAGTLCAWGSAAAGAGRRAPCPSRSGCPGPWPRRSSSPPSSHGPPPPRAEAVESRVSGRTWSASLVAVVVAGALTLDHVRVSEDELYDAADRAAAAVDGSASESLDLLRFDVEDRLGREVFLDSVDTPAPEEEGQNVDYYVLRPSERPSTSSSPRTAAGSSRCRSHGASAKGRDPRVATGISRALCRLTPYSGNTTQEGLIGFDFGTLVPGEAGRGASDIS